MSAASPTTPDESRSALRLSDKRQVPSSLLLPPAISPRASLSSPLPSPADRRGSFSALHALFSSSTRDLTAPDITDQVCVCVCSRTITRVNGTANKRALLSTYSWLDLIVGVRVQYKPFIKSPVKKIIWHKLLFHSVPNLILFSLSLSLSLFLSHSLRVCIWKLMNCMPFYICR